MGNLHRPYVRSFTRQGMWNNAERNQTNEKGEVVDPNTGKVLDKNAHAGHEPGMENRGFISYGEKAGMSQKELNNTVNNPGLYQPEDGKSNMGHEHEEKDPNQTALNTANYCYLENPDYQKNTYINPPASENDPWTISVVNKETDIESQVGTFQPDLGEVTEESQAAIESAITPPASLTINTEETASDNNNTNNDDSNANNDNDSNTNNDGDGNTNNDDDSNSNNDDDGMCM